MGAMKTWNFQIETFAVNDNIWPNRQKLQCIIEIRDTHSNEIWVTLVGF